MQGSGTSRFNCSSVMRTASVRNPMLSAASLMPSMDTPSRVMNERSRRVCRE